MQIAKPLLLVLLSASTVGAITYYVDPTCPSSGSGREEACGSEGPFKSWTEVPWAAGNTYAQRGSTTYYGTITVGASGTADGPITITSYGSGKALLDGGIVLSPESWGAPDGNGVYRQAGFGYGLLEDDVFLEWCPTDACAAGRGNYRYVWGGGSPEYYKPTSGTPADHVTKKLTSVGIQLKENSYINIAGFSLRHYAYGITGTILGTGKTNNYINIYENDFSDMQFGVWIDFNKAKSSGVRIHGNTFAYIMSSIEMQNKGDCKSSPGIFDAMDILGNTISNCAEVRGVNKSYYWDSVNTAGWDMEGIGFQNLSNSSVHGNNITGHCRGIVLFVCSGDEAFNNNFYSNRIDTDGECLMFYPRADSLPAKSFYNNNAYANVLARGNRGWNTTLYAGNVPSPVDKYNNIFNNTFVSPGNGILGTVATDYYDVRNNIFYDVGNYMVYLPSATAPSHMIFDYNLYKSRNSWSSWSIGGSGKSWATWKVQGAGNDLHSPALGNPLFKDVANGNYSLTAASPAKWAGVDAGVRMDVAANPFHSPPSIGAYEYLDFSVPTPPQGFKVE